jgi:predicted ATP-dependent endonuclease of OLD family
MAFHLQINDYRRLRWIDINPDGVCLIVGANGVGKSILLSSLELLRNTFLHGFGRALSSSGGAHGFKNFDLPSETQPKLSIEIAGFCWELKLLRRWWDC